MRGGIFCSIGASLCFGIIFFLAAKLTALQASDIFAFRVVFTIICLTIFLYFAKEMHLVKETLARYKAKPTLVLCTLFCAAMFGFQQYLFLWAAGAGKAIDVSLGYFMFPLSMVVTGRILFNDRLTRFQKAAFVFALLGVANQLIEKSSFSWVTLAIVLGNPPYFAIRRMAGLDNLGELWLEILILTPISLAILYFGDVNLGLFNENKELYILVPFLGITTALAFILYIMASRLLTFSLFGLLSYVEPVLLMAVAIAIGGTIAQEEIATYVGIWTAVICLCLDGVKASILSHRHIKIGSDDFDPKH